MTGCIASPHWEACKTCTHHGSDGCRLGESITLDIYLGDWIICEDYEKEQIVSPDTLPPCDCGEGDAQYPELHADECAINRVQVS